MWICEEYLKYIYILGTIGKYCYSLEFQKRWLLHAPILIILKENDRVHYPDGFDKKGCAKLPNPYMEARFTESLQITWVIVHVAVSGSMGGK